MKKIAVLLVVAILGGIISLSGYKLFFSDAIVVERTTSESFKTAPVNYTPAIHKMNSISSSVDLTTAAENTVNSVVHVKNISIISQVNPIDIFFGNGGREKQYEQVGTGSGVIISQDGYIVTNYHVIAGATQIEVTLNNRQKYAAQLVGDDKENDIALLKIDTDDELAYIPFANSNTLQIGEWVLAVGNPYNLTSTVTAGIVSAKGRNINIVNNKFPIESFIQKSNHEDKTAELVIITHEASKSMLDKALLSINKLDGVISDPVCLSIYS